VIRKHIAKGTFVIFTGALALVGGVLAQLPQTQPDRSQMLLIQAPLRVNNDEDLKFFTGKIYSNNGRYVLDGESSRGPYLLDDQKMAKQYEGKHVRVIGVLEVANNTIHVRNIEEASG
jgi:uridine phosphorylase